GSTGRYIQYRADLATTDPSQTPVLQDVTLRVGSTGATNSLLVAGFPSSVPAGTSGTVTVTARDASGNAAPGYPGTVHFTSSDVQAALPADYTFTAADNGVHTFAVTFKTAGTQAVTATDTATASNTGTQTGIVVNPAAASTMVVSGFPSPA